MERLVHRKLLLRLGSGMEEREAEESCPESYFCPISHELMEDPVRNNKV